MGGNDGKRTLKAKASQLNAIYTTITKEVEQVFERELILGHDCDLEQAL